MKFSILFFMLFGFLTVQGQEAKEIKYTRIGADYQYNFAKMDVLNETLQRSGFIPLKDQADYFNFYVKSGKASSKWMSTFGFSFYQRVNGGLRNADVVPVKSADIIGFGISSGLEYRFVDTKYFFANPLLSFDFEYYKLAFTENINISDLGSILNSDVNTYSATSFQIPIRVGLRAGVNIPVKQQFVSLAFTAGYKWHSSNQNWKINDVVPIGSPVNLSSLFAGVSMEFTMFPEK